MRRMIVASLAVFGLCAFQEAAVSTITVQGEGRAEQPAERFAFTAYVTARNDDQEAALRTVSDAIERLRNDLTRMEGLTTLETEFTELTVEPIRAECPNYRDECPITGWAVDAPVNVIGAPAIEGPNAVSLAVELGSTEVSDLSYLVADPDALAAAARDAAIADARRQAEAIAQSLGQRITGVQAVRYRGDVDITAGLESGASIIVTGSRIAASVRFEADQPIRFEDDEIAIVFTVGPSQD